MYNPVMVPAETLSYLMYCSFQYCLGKKLFAVSFFIDNLITYWRYSLESDKEVMQKEIKAAKNVKLENG